MSEAIDKSEAFLNGLPRFADAGASAYKPGLARMGRLMEAMGNPHERIACVHVAGTNGKGSTASLIAAIGTAAGRRIGLHTSPHLFHVTERMRIDGKPVMREWLARTVDAYRVVADEVEPSYFELTTALSLLYFAQEKVDVAVVEVGMGGRLDATNVIPHPLLSIVTDVGLDHMEHLGGSIEEIAKEKAGIIKPEVPVLSGARPEAAAVIASVARERNAPVHQIEAETTVLSHTCDMRGTSLTVETPVRTYHDLFVGLAGRHQIRNALTALRAAELVYEEVRSDHRPVFEGMRHVRELSGLRGRLETLRADPLIIADVAHNPEGLASALAHLRDCGRLSGRLDVLFAVMRDKDVQAMARLLAHDSITVRPVALSSERALPPGELADILKVCGAKCTEPASVEEGIRAFLADASHTDTLLITGSHLVVSQLADASL